MLDSWEGAGGVDQVTRKMVSVPVCHKPDETPAAALSPCLDQIADIKTGQRLRQGCADSRLWRINKP